MIEYISADRGGLTLYFRNANGKLDLAGWGTTPETLTELLKKYGVADTIRHSSSMDFASEEDFIYNNGAWRLWDDTVYIYNWKHPYPEAEIKINRVTG